MNATIPTSRPAVAIASTFDKPPHEIRSYAECPSGCASIMTNKNVTTIAQNVGHRTTSCHVNVVAAKSIISEFCILKSALLCDGASQRRRLHRLLVLRHVEDRKQLLLVEDHLLAAAAREVVQTCELDGI